MLGVSPSLQLGGFSVVRFLQETLELAKPAVEAVVCILPPRCLAWPCSGQTLRQTWTLFLSPSFSLGDSESCAESDCLA